MAADPAGYLTKHTKITKKTKSRHFGFSVLCGLPIAAVSTATDGAISSDQIRLGQHNDCSPRDARGTIGLAHVANDRFLIFAFRSTYLIVHESLGRANGIDDAETKVLAEVTGQLQAKFTGSHSDRVLINLGKLVGGEFLRACAICQGPGPSKVLDSVHKGNSWEITLQGQWQEKITLDNKYQVTGTVRLN